MRTVLWWVHAHRIVMGSCAPYCDVFMRTVLWCVHAHRIVMCSCAPYCDVFMRTVLSWVHTHLIVNNCDGFMRWNSRIQLVIYWRAGSVSAGLWGSFLLTGISQQPIHATIHTDVMRHGLWGSFLLTGISQQPIHATIHTDVMRHDSL